MADIQEYSVSIKFKTEGTDKASKDTDKVKDSLGKLKSSTKSFDGLKSGFASFTKGFGKVTTVIKGVTAAAGAGLVKVGKSAATYSKGMMDYIETVNLFNTSMGDLAEKAREFVEEGEIKLGLNPQEMMDSLSSFQNLSEGFGIASDRAYIMSKNLTQLAGDLSSFANISFETAQKKLMSGFSGQVMPLRKYGIALDQASLQELAYSLGLEQKVKTMTRAQKSELIYYQIMKSTQKMQGDLGRTLMSPANALRVMKNEFTALARAVGSIFIPIIQKVIPYVRMLTKVLTQAANAIATFFGFNIEDYTADLSGLSDGFGDIGGDIEDVGDAAEGTAKKMNKMLMPFDELNNINSNAGSGSGAGAGGIGGGSLGLDLPEYNMFEFIDDRVMKFGDILEKAKQAAKNINEFLGGIDWSTIKESSGVIGKNIAEFLNVGIQDINWRTIGQTFGEGINTIIELVNNFVKTIDFKQLGADWAQGINGIFETVEWDKLGETISTGLKGVADTVAGHLENIEVDKMIIAVKDFVVSFDLMGTSEDIAFKIGEGVGKSIPKAFEGIGKIIEEEVSKQAEGVSFDNKPEMFRKIYETLYEAGRIMTLAITDPIGGLGQLIREKLGKSFAEGFADSLGWKGSIDKFKENVNKAIEDMIAGVQKILQKYWGILLRSWQNSINVVIGGLNKIIDAMNTVGEKFGIHIERLNEVKWADEYEKRMKEIGENTKNVVTDMNKAVTDKTNELQRNTQAPLNLLRTDFDTTFNGIKNTASDDMTETQNATAKKAEEIKNTINSSFSIARSKAQENTTGIKNETTNNFEQIANSSVYSRIKTSITTALDNAQKARELGSSTATGYKEGFEGTASHFSIMSTVKDRFRQALGSYSEAHQWGSDMATGFKDGLNAKQQEIINKVREMANSIRSMLHFSRPDEGPLRDYETWMPDMIKGLSSSLIQAAPILDNAVNQIADRMAESLSNIEIPGVEQSVYASGYTSQVVKNIANKATSSNSNADESTTNMIRATYEAVSRALTDAPKNNEKQPINVYVGNKELYRGYGQYQDEQSNMLGVTV